MSFLLNLDMSIIFGIMLLFALIGSFQGEVGENIDLRLSVNKRKISI